MRSSSVARTAVLAMVVVALGVFLSACGGGSDSTSGEEGSGRKRRHTGQGRRPQVRPQSGRRRRPQPDQRTEQRLDLRHPADLRPAGRDRRRQRSGPRPGDQMGKLLRRPDLDLPPPRREVLQRRTGHRRRRQILDRTVRRSGNQRQLLDARANRSRTSTVVDPEDGEGQPQTRRRVVPRQHLDVRGGDPAEKGVRKGRRKRFLEQPGRNRPVQTEGIRPRPEDGARTEPDVLAQRPAVSRRHRLRIRPRRQHPGAENPLRTKPKSPTPSPTTRSRPWKAPKGSKSRSARR